MKPAVPARVRMIAAMTIFGTIGLFVRNIPLPSSVIACVRGFVGTAFLVLVMVLQKRKASKEEIRRNLALLVITGAVIGFNWILLFESYRYTTVATATLCYYLAPIFVIIVSPVLLKEKLSVKKVACVVVALLGMVCVSGVIEGGLPAAGEAKGILLGLGAAVLYAFAMLGNRWIQNIDIYTKTAMQLFTAAAVALPYVLLTEDVSSLSLTAGQTALLLMLGVVHTGFAYALYFGALGSLPMQTAAILSYIDPVVAILLSALLLREPMSVWGVIGAVLILGSALVSELPERKKKL